MCKLFGAVLNPPRSPEELYNFRHFALRDSDGWGIAWYDNGRLKLRKSTESALRDVKYLEAARLAKSGLIIAHLRRMTMGSKRTVNTHPFVFGKYVFAHNGTVDISELIYYLRDTYRQLKGDTDSEVLFHFILQNMKKWGNFMGLRRAVKEISKEARERKVTSINFLMTDGRYLYAYKRVFRGGNNLYYTHRSGFYKTFIVSSKPLGEGWVEMGNGEFLVVDSTDHSIIRTMIV